MNTYADVHAGDVVLDGSGQAWGVEMIIHKPTLTVTLVRHGIRATGYPPAGTVVTVISRGDVSAEMVAYEVLASAFGDVSLIQERWDES